MYDYTYNAYVRLDEKTMTNYLPGPAETGFPAHFHVAVDVVALTIKRNMLQVAVVQRRSATSCIYSENLGFAEVVERQPTDYALPGGHVNWQKENLIEAAIRELREETSISVQPEDLVQIGAYGEVGRDPRPGRTLSIAFLAFSPDFAAPFAGSDAANAQFIDVVEVLAEPNRLEFDHNLIIRDAIVRVRDLLERTPIALKFCDDVFTLKDLRRVYEVMFHAAYNHDADTYRYAERIRKDDRVSGDREFEGTIESISRAVLSSPGVHEMMLPMSDLSMRLSSGSQIPREVAVVNKIQKLLNDEYRRASGPSSKGRETARDKLRLSFDPANFARKVDLITGFVERIEGETRPSLSGTGKPAQLYRRGKLKKLDPPLIIRTKPSKPPKPRPAK